MLPRHTYPRMDIAIGTKGQGLRTRKTKVCYARTLRKLLSGPDRVGGRHAARKSGVHDINSDDE